MSETEDEPFDKEAEKEKLRQQLAEEEADRQATQHMSELLLQGATMTNRHCNECGDPVFRQGGREFCPTCGRERVEEAEAGQAAVDGGAETAPAVPGEPDAETASAGSAGSAETAGQDTSPPSSQSAASQSPGPARTGEADLAAAREALARKVTALAREAEATTDVGRARELLAAVREGAEAIRALDDAGW